MVTWWKAAQWGKRLWPLLAFWLCIRQAPAQEVTSAEILASYEGQTVSNVELAGRPEISGPALERLQSLVTQKPGQPFELARIDESIQALKDLHEFADVQLDVLPEENGLRVRLLLEPAYYIGEYTFPGANRSFPYSRLLQVSHYIPQQPYSLLDIQDAEAALREYFRREGFFQSHVKATVRADGTHLLAGVQFNTALNQRARFGEVTVDGVDPLEAAKLQHSITTFRARLRSARVRSGGSYSYKRLQNAAQYMQRQLESKDYLSARVELSPPNYSADDNRADVVFQATPGQLLSVETTGAKVRGRTVRRLVPLYGAGSFSSELVQEGEQNLKNYFQSKGYFDAQVSATVNKNSQRTTVRYEISRGPRGRVAEVAVTGNQHLPQKQLMPHVTVKRAKWLLSRGTYSEQLQRASVRNLENVYRNAGYSSVRIEPQVSRRNRDLVLVLDVIEGPQDVTESFHVEGNTVPLFQLAPKGLRIAPGGAYSLFLVSQDRNGILAHYLTLGYLSATFHATGTPVAKGSHRFKVVYTINEGPQVKIAQLITLGRQHTQQHLIDVTADLKPGRPLGRDQTLVAESRLYGLDIFDWAEIDTRRPIAGQNQADVLIKVHEARRNAVIFGFGFDVINRGGTLPSGTVALPGLPPVALPSTFTTSESTFVGPRGSVTYTRRNLQGMGQAFSATALAARLDQHAGASYTIPAFRGSSWTAGVSSSFEHTSENPIYTASIARAGLEFRKPLDAQKTKTLFFRYTFSHTTITNLLIPDLVPPQDRDIRLSTLSVSYARDTRDFVLDAHKGIYQSFQIDFNPSWLGSNASFARFLGQVAYYKNIGAGIIFANSIRLGLEHAIGNSFVPLSEEFFTGGASTLRGFPLNGAGPQRTVQVCSNPAVLSTCTLIQAPTGGNQLLILNSELRMPLPLKKGLSVVTFYDGGNVFSTIGFHNFGGNYSNSVGGGLRYSTPVGPIRFDVGHNLSPIPGIKATQIFVTLGQAF